MSTKRVKNWIDPLGERVWPDLPQKLYDQMEIINRQMAPRHAWLRTHPLPPGQRPGTKELFLSRLGASSNSMLAQIHGHREICEPFRYTPRRKYFHPQITKAAKIVPIEFTERRSFLFMNPGLGGDLKKKKKIRSAYSFYNPGDIADVHLHTPNASRLIQKLAEIKKK